MNMTEEMRKHFEKLKNSSIANDDFRYDILNLCGAIKTLSGVVQDTVDDLRKCDEESKERYIEKSIDSLLQIYSIANVIGEKIDGNEFMEVINLLYEYKQIGKRSTFN